MLWLCLLMCFNLAKGIAQEAVASGGGDAWGNNGSVAYSVGQLAYTSNIGANSSVAFGVQQPYEILIKTGAEELGINLNLSVFPNPTTDFLILKVDKSFDKMDYQLYNMGGKLLLSKKLEGSVTHIPLAEFDRAMYLLNVKQNNRVLKAFKIIKN